MMIAAESIQQTFLLTGAGAHRSLPPSLHAESVSSAAAVRRSLSSATRHTLWICSQQRLTAQLFKEIRWPSPPLGQAVFLHPLTLDVLPLLVTCFRRFAFASEGRFLPADELLEVMAAEHRQDLFIGGSVSANSQTLTLWRGSLEPLTIPWSALEISGDGVAPDFQRFSVTDFGQTIRLGEYEAASEAILYEYDADFRRRRNRLRVEGEQTFGAALRRLRKQRGLRREDFGPEIAAKTVARIEQGKVQRIHSKTLQSLALRLKVRPEEIGSF